MFKEKTQDTLLNNDSRHDCGYDQVVYMIQVYN